MIIFFVVLYLILIEWYPEPLFSTDGGWKGIQIIAFVDIILGPSLTLIVYRRGKHLLNMDMAIIALIQFSALLSGILVVYNEHPVAIIIVNYRLHPITASQAAEAEINISTLKLLSDFQPPIIFSNLPTDSDELIKISRESIKKGLGLKLFDQYYVKLSNKIKTHLMQGSMLLESYIKENPKYADIYNSFLINNKTELSKLIFFPLYSRYEYKVAVLDKETFAILEVLDIFPPRLGDKYTTLGK